MRLRSARQQARRLPGEGQRQPPRTDQASPFAVERQDLRRRRFAFQGQEVPRLGPQRQHLEPFEPRIARRPRRRRPHHRPARRLPSARLGCGRRLFLARLRYRLFLSRRPRFGRGRRPERCGSADREEEGGGRDGGQDGRRGRDRGRVSRIYGFRSRRQARCHHAQRCRRL